MKFPSCTCLTNHNTHSTILDVMAVYKSPVIPIHDATDLSIPQFMTCYNPDEVSASKIVHTDTFSGDAITYGSLRDEAGRAAWGLQSRLGLQQGDTLLALVNNSVRESRQDSNGLFKSNRELRMLLFFSPMRHGGQVLFSRRYNNFADLETLLITFLGLLIHRQRKMISCMFSRSLNQPILPLSKRSSALYRPL